MGIRSYIITELTAKLPRKWKFVPYQSNLDELGPRDVVVMLKLQNFGRSPEAPGGAYTANYVLTLVLPGLDPEPVENALDDKVIDFLYAIESIKNVRIDKADRVVVGALQGYDITIEVITKKE